MSPNERQLVARARQGNTEAFEALVNIHAQYVYNLALRVLGNPQDAEDISQEAFLRAWQALPRFRGEAKFSTWIYRIVTNLCYNRLPRIRKELETLETEDGALTLPDKRQNVENAVLEGELRDELHQGIDNLSESYRLLITLRHLQEMSYNEIAQVTGMPIGTVKTGIYRARRKLQAVVEAYEVNLERT